MAWESPAIPPGQHVFKPKCDENTKSSELKRSCSSRSFQRKLKIRLREIFRKLYLWSIYLMYEIEVGKGWEIKITRNLR